MVTESYQESSRISAADHEDAERRARAALADPDVGSPEEGETTIEEDPPG